MHALDVLLAITASPAPTQLTAAYNDPAFQSAAKAAGWTVRLTDTQLSGGTVIVTMTHRDTKAGCSVHAVADPRATTRNCLDL